MKNFLIIMLLLVHTAASSGTVLSLHYCMGDFASVSIGHKDKKGCDKCGMENKGCCHDDVRVIKIDNNSIVYANNHTVLFQPVEVVYQETVDYNANFYRNSQSHPNEPIFLIKGPPLFLLNCNFRI